MDDTPKGTSTGAFELVGSETAFSGHHLAVRRDTYRTPEGAEYQREVMVAGEVVVVCAWDREGVWMVRQPREAVGEAALLELIAGHVDPSDSSPEEAARRELGEEAGLRAHDWVLVRSFYASPGATDEVMHLFLATNLLADPDLTKGRDADERLDLVRIPLSDLGKTLASCRDAKSIIGLFGLRCVLADI